MKAVDPRARSRNGCLCCGSLQMTGKHSVISPYFAYKAWNGPPQHVMLNRCENCGFLFFDRGLSEEEASAYYNGYRDERYFQERKRFEPFYTRSQHDQISSFLRSEQRRIDLAAALSASGVSRPLECVVDYGGGDGSLISELQASRKISFEFSGAKGVPGVEVMKNRSELPDRVDLITCAQVLEHVSNPGALIEDMVKLLCPGGLLYLEVPNQLWRTMSALQLNETFLSWLCRKQKLLLAADIYSTAFRVKLGFLPPFGFTPMREHINFYTAQALREAAVARGLKVETEGKMSDGSFFLVGRRV